MKYGRMVANIICDTFRKEVGTWGGNPPGKSHGKPQRALRVNFAATCDYATEDGYRYLDLLVFAEANYVGVYFQRTWNVRPVLKLPPNQEGGYGDYTTGASEWIFLCYHDSCWPEGVERFLLDNEQEIACLGGLNDWFDIVTLEKEVVAKLRQARLRRHQGRSEPGLG